MIKKGTNMASFHRKGKEYDTLFAGSVNLDEKGKITKAWNGRGESVNFKNLDVQILSKWEISKNCSSLPTQ